MANGGSEATGVSPITAGGPGTRSRAPGGGPGGSAPGSSWVLVFSRCQEKLFLDMFSVKIGVRKTKIYLIKMSILPICFV